MQQLKHEQHVAAVVSKQQHALEEDDKAFLVERQRRSNNFQRLVFVADLSAKRERADHAAVQRSHSSMS